MKAVRAVFLLVVMAVGAMGRPSQSGSANLYVGPKRIVGKHLYDLQPLFDWWQGASQKSELDISDLSKADARPLTRWVRVTGKYVQGMHSGWQVEADIYEVPRRPTHMRIVLLHPPAAEKKEFEALLAEKGRLEAGIAQANSDHAAASADARYFRGQASYDVLGTPRSAYINGQPATVAPVLSHWENSGMRKKANRSENAAESALADKEDMSSRLSEVNARLDAISPDHEVTFPIDCFAMFTGQMYAPTRQWIYDCGARHK